MVYFKVAGEVLGKPRPRVNRSGHVWTPSKFKEYGARIAEAYKAAGGEVHSDAVEVEIDVFRALPKSRPKKVEAEQDTFKPDADNIAKLVLDALNGVAYEDDALVVSMKVTKHPRTRRKEFMMVKVAPVAIFPGETAPE